MTAAEQSATLTEIRYALLFHRRELLNAVRRRRAVRERSVDDFTAWQSVFDRRWALNTAIGIARAAGVDIREVLR